MISDLKELQAFLKLCRKQGITQIKVGEISVNFGDLPAKPSDTGEEDTSDALPTEEEMIFYST